MLLIMLLKTAIVLNWFDAREVFEVKNGVLKRALLYRINQWSRFLVFYFSLALLSI
jgi:hypothetical protein